MANLLPCVLLLALCTGAQGEEIDYAQSLREIARDIAALKPGYPQLAQFEPTVHGGSSQPAISYDFHTHAAPQAGGWGSMVPNPDADGVWFYIDFHDPDSTLAIHTQPVIAAQCIGAKRVSVLILEGSQTRKLEGEIQKILRHRGVGRC